MSQKGQIPKHEWVPGNTKGEEQCVNCTCVRVKMRSGQTAYWIKGTGFRFNEPKCITRKITDNGTK